MRSIYVGLRTAVRGLGLLRRWVATGMDVKRGIDRWMTVRSLEIRRPSAYPVVLSRESIARDNLYTYPAVRMRRRWSYRGSVAGAANSGCITAIWLLWTRGSCKRRMRNAESHDSSGADVASMRGEVEPCAQAMRQSTAFVSHHDTVVGLRRFLRVTPHRSLQLLVCGSSVGGYVVQVSVLFVGCWVAMAAVQGCCKRVKGRRHGEEERTSRQLWLC